jgi:hypothetical protein
MGLGFVKHFTAKSYFTCTDEAASSVSFCNSDELSRVMPGKKKITY